MIDSSQMQTTRHDIKLLPARSNEICGNAETKSFPASVPLMQV
jgi:hypothetical protein